MTVARMTYDLICTLPVLDETDTQRLAAQIAALTPAGSLIALAGPLGAGKTVFARAFIRSLTGNPQEEVPSPTFTLIQHYEQQDGSSLCHADLYRLEPGEEIDDLLLDDVLIQGIALVEWPDRLPADLLQQALLIRFETTKNVRHIHLYAPLKSDWVTRLETLSSPSPKKAPAMVLAAGRGTRMGEISNTLPKPLVTVSGRALIDHALDRIKAAQMDHAVINIHHLVSAMRAHLTPYVTNGFLTLSEEKDLLETGGGVKKALPLLNAQSFAVINADVILVDNGQPLLNRLKEAFDPEKMDMLLALVPLEKSTGWKPEGDIHLNEEATIAKAVSCRLRAQDEQAHYAYTGTMQISAAAYSDTPSGAFSNRDLFVRAQKTGRLYGLIHHGTAHHVGTPEAIAEAEAALEVHTAETPINGAA